MVKTKRKSILRTLLCAVFALCFAVGLSSLFANGTTAYAATTPKYTVKFNWSTKTTTGTGGGTGSNTASGSGVSYSMQTGQYSFADYSVTIYGSSSSGTGTFESGSYIGSNSVNVIINSKVKIPTTISSNGTTVAKGNNNSFSLSNLADGTYTVTSTFGAAWATSPRSGISKSYSFTFQFKIDRTAPTMNNVSTSSTGKYTNSSTYVSASDSMSGVECIYMKTPGSSSYGNMGTSTTVSSSGMNGLYSFYAKDKAGNTSRTYFLYLDTVKPTGTIKNSNGTEITGSYTNQTFSYSATDSGSGISYLQYRKPGSSSWLTYTSGTSISASAASGTYQFRAVDKAGNISATKSITLDSSKPTMTLYSGDVSVSNGFKSIANYIKATATDSGSGVKTIYVKKPGASSYTEYASGTQLTADGAYSFYCVDNAGNASQTYTISMDHTRPTITSSVGGFGKTLKDGFTVTASDNYSGVTLYYKTPNSTSFVASTTSSVVFSKTAVNGTYVFYAVDGFGNKSDTNYMYMSIDAPEATIVKSDNSHKVCVIWTASNCYATLNGKSYTSGTWIEQEGEYSFVITNDANRSTTYKFTVDHYYARYSMVAPTCTQKGYTIYKCTGCGDSYDGDFIEAKGHDYESKIVKPTCTAQGYTRYTCKTCGNTYSDNFVEAEGHRYGEWTTVKEPTCVDLGKDERTCSVCSYVDERDTDALGHSYKDIVVDPSCTDRGNTIHECERCGHTYTDSYTEATGHDFGEWTSLTKPTCTASGVEQRKCTSCPQTETKIVSPLGHNYKAEVVSPTCLEQGYTTHICSRCGTGYNDTFVPPLGHDYEEIEIAPTCTEEGYRGKKCRRCEDCVKTEILKAVGHKFTDSYFIATCEDEGYTLHTCLSCGNEYKDNIVPATGHDYETEVVREPHCETEGERKFHCTKCEKEYYSDIPATGHNYELTGTEEVNGENIRTYVCTNCGAITTQNMGEQYEQVSSYIEYLFGQYQPYMWWVLLATAGVWSIVMGVFFAIAQKNEDKEKARKMIKNYVIGLVVIFAILVACPYLVKGIAALIAG